MNKERVFVAREKIGEYVLAGEQEADAEVAPQELGNAISLQ